MGEKMANKKGVVCDCGFEAWDAPQEEPELIATVKSHIKRRHQQPEPSDQDVRKMMKNR